MKQRGGRSAASLAITPVLEHAPVSVQPPATLSEPARAVFLDLVGSCNPEHFENSDVGLLCQYCEAQAMAERAAAELQNGEGESADWALKLWEKANKVMSGLALRLRLVAGSLALILHLTDDPNINPIMPVDDDAIGAAEHIVRDFILPYAFEFYGIGVNEQDRLRRLASFILTSGKTRIVASDLTTNVWDMRGLTLKEVNDRMSPLEAGGWVEPETRVSFNNKAWRVSPAVAAKFAARQRVEAERKAAIVEMIAKNAD